MQLGLVPTTPPVQRDNPVEPQSNKRMSVANLSPSQVEAIRALHRAGIRPPTSAVEARRIALLDVCAHMESTFYIPETSQPIVLEEFQRIVLRIIAGEHTYPTLLPFYSTIEWSSTKKTGKTATSGGYAKWRSESPTLRDEILFFANDETQSRGRAYAAIQVAIELNPHYDKPKRTLYDAEGNAIWRVIEDYLLHVPTDTKVRAVNVDYRGEAGANPTLTVWTECWGYDTDKQFKLFEEMTPVLTRQKSQRYLEGYAGYTGKSKVQEFVEGLVTDPDKGGRQLTLNDVPDWPWPDEELLPLYVNDDAGMFAYLDRGPIVRRRMPWLMGPVADQYYREQERTLPPEQFDRLHNNYWVSPVSAFIPIEWWNQCAEDITALAPYREPIKITSVPTDDADQLVDVHGEPQTKMVAYRDVRNWRVVGPGTAVILGVDASVVGDCTALVAVTRHPARHNDIMLTHAYMWTPPRGGKMDYDTSPDARGVSLSDRILDLVMRYNVIQIAYDNWQLHHLMTQLRNQGIVWAREFSQSRERDVADKQLYDLIRTRRITYDLSNQEITHADIKRHMIGAARQQRAKEDTKLHIVKASDDAKIDLVVALSMATAECLRLDL